MRFLDYFVTAECFADLVLPEEDQLETQSPLPQPTVTLSAFRRPTLPVHESVTLSVRLFASLAAPALILQTYTYSVALVRKRTIPTERPPLVGEISANFCG
jgi:hypothetical protein